MKMVFGRRRPQEKKKKKKRKQKQKQKSRQGQNNAERLSFWGVQLVMQLIIICHRSSAAARGFYDYLWDSVLLLLVQVYLLKSEGGRTDDKRLIKRV